MRRAVILGVVVTLLLAMIMFVGCGSKVVNYTSPSGKTYTPDQFRSELQTLYDDYKEAKKKFEENDSDDNKEILVKKFKAIEAFDPFVVSAEEYDAKGQPAELSSVSEERIENTLQFDDEKLSTAIESANKYNEAR